MLKKSNGATIFSVDFTKKAEPLVIKNGRVIDPVNDIDKITNVIIEDGVIKAVADEIPVEFRSTKSVDASGKWVIPGLMDMHVHLREPGREDKETIATGTQAAAAGGFTAVACMPNTTPALDEESKIRYVIQHAEQCPCRIYPIGAISKGLEGEELAPMGEMVRAGARAVSDDGKSVNKSNIMRNAFNYTKSFNIPIICHCEDPALSQKGHMNEGVVSTRLGVRGIPTIAEEIVVARDLLLAEYTQSRVHIAHVSTAGSVRLIRDAKERGVNVTAETCPHYIAQTDEDVGLYDTHKKMNPPLRTAKDRDVVIEGLKDGTIDIIVSDHAPHVPEEKDVEFEAANFGVIGLETSFSVINTYLVKKSLLSPSEMVKKMSVIPNKILGVNGGSLSVGAAADITVVDTDTPWKVDPKNFFSKSRNTSFEGYQLQGFVSMTILDGHIVFERKQ
jgi:dihydroorotase